MIKLDDIERIYFLGIGGIGMSALARYFVAKRFKVAEHNVFYHFLMRLINQFH